ncbi:MAG TPA: hypothetical protein VG621_03750 [Candidatus Paceibacterota bacterium]|nr:hypothetical protein [Candidatus Paceibacterota bacterium]
MSRSKKWNDAQLKNAVLDSRSIRQVLQKIGLVEKLCTNPTAHRRSEYLY